PERPPVGLVLQPDQATRPATQRLAISFFMFLILFFRGTDPRRQGRGPARENSGARKRATAVPGERCAKKRAEMSVKSRTGAPSTATGYPELINAGHGPDARGRLRASPGAGPAAGAASRGSDLLEDRLVDLILGDLRRDAPPRQPADAGAAADVAVA